MDIYENVNPEEQQEQMIPDTDTQSEPAMNDALSQQEVIPEEDTAEVISEEPVVEMIAEEPVAEVLDEPVAEEIPEEPKVYRKPSPYADSPYVMRHAVEQPVKKKKVRKARKPFVFRKKSLVAVLALAILVSACAITASVVSNYWEDRLDTMEDSFEERWKTLEEKFQPKNNGNATSGIPVAPTDGLTPAQVYAMNVDSVVLIHNEVTANYNGQVGVGMSAGSGFILNEDGYVVTNYHVVEGNGKLTVILSNGEEYPATLVGADETNDVALLKMQGEGFPAVTLGSSSDLIVGDQVVAIGNPLGELTSTLTVGYISAKERDVNTSGFAINMLQTDAAINSGNSGGPLFNMRGEVIGITTAKYSGTSSSGATIEGVGFAIPIDDVSGLLSDLANYGYVTGAYLGVSVSDMDPDAANYYGFPMGAYVQSVQEGYAAHRGGIQAKDIITSVGGIRVENVNDLTRALRNFEAGDLTVVTVYRGGRELNLKITLDEKPIDGKQPQTPSGQDQMPEGDFDEWYDYLAPFFGGKD